MGQYKFSMCFSLQIGLMVKYTGYSIDISLPFIEIIIATEKDANGVSIFGNNFN